MPLMFEYFDIALPREFLSVPKNFSLDTKSNLDTATVDVPLPGVLGELERTLKGRPLFFRFPSNTFYDFHIDRTRKCALNYLLTAEDGQLYFGTPGQKVVSNLIEVPYSSSFLLINTSLPHAVLTRSERIIFSLGFNNTPFEKVSSVLNSLLEGE